ncbi:MAG: hypothetical protein ACK5TQ_01890 [Acetobacteraceae bacterium]|jgi:NAD(P)H-dependent flavin oxidoreductase YrpB (nitropropane dioxygenase family)
MEADNQQGEGDRKQCGLDAAFAAGVRHFETAGRAPADDLIARIRDAGGIVIHKVP